MCHGFSLSGGVLAALAFVASSFGDSWPRDSARQLSSGRRQAVMVSPRCVKGLPAVGRGWFRARRDVLGVGALVVVAVGVQLQEQQ
jgi:hypothetical protein